MSGWIKLEKDRRDDPRVLRMARQLRHAPVTLLRDESVATPNVYVTLVLGCLDVLWCYADTHIREDDTLDLGPDEIDELVGLRGFSSLMPPDWLELLEDHRVKLPDFHRHNGTESKRKALSQKRSERYRHTPVTPQRDAGPAPGHARASPDQDQDQDHIEKEASRARANVGRVDEQEHHAQFLRLQAAYPKFSGRSNWMIAEGHCRTRIEQGATWEDLVSAVERYAAYVAAGGASTTQHVLRPETFFSASDEPWRQRWDPPEPITGGLNGRPPLPPRPTRFEQIMGKEEVVIVDAS